MKKLITCLCLCVLCIVGCEKEEKEKCDCDQCPCEMVRDAEPSMEEDDMGLEGGAEQEDLPVGGQDVSGGEQMEEPVLPVAGEMMPEEDCGERPEDEEMCVPEEEEEEVVDCECESAEECEC